jgi:TRAP-type C4-dicarboxylate transport system permease small subunit
MRILDRIVEGTAATLMLTICVTVFLGVFYRYVLVSPLGWSEEIARYCLIWNTFFGSYLALRRSEHIGLQLGLPGLPPVARRVQEAVGLLAMALFFVVLVAYGTPFALRFLESESPYLEIPLGLVYLILPVAGALLLVALAAECRRRWTEAGAAAGRPAGASGGSA